MKFSDTYLLPRAGRYQNEKNSNDRLPLPYGDLTDGSDGNWVLPCISTVTYVYCYSAAPVLSATSGNVMAIYSGGSEVNAADYTFSESNNFESLGSISTITFDNDQENNQITARGTGILDSSGVTYLDNIVDIANDFLATRAGLNFSYDLTSKSKVDSLFDSQGYKAAGVIESDGKVWDIVQNMMGSFLGSIYFNGNDRLELNMEVGSSSTDVAAIIPRQEVILTGAKQRMKNLINRCPTSFAYNYVDNDFRSHDDGNLNINSGSSEAFGITEPNVPYKLYWCRAESSVSTIERIITTKYGNPIWELEFTDTTLKRVHVDVGDIVAVGFDNLYDVYGNKLINQVVKIVSVIPDLEKNQIKFRGIDEGVYLINSDGTRDTNDYV